VKALITGGAGFIGSHLTARLLEERHEVVVLDDLSTGSSENLVRLGGSDLNVVVGSVLDEPLVDELARQTDTIFHLAASVGVKRIIDDPLEGLRTNIRGTEIVLESAALHGARVLLASTSEIYGRNTSDALSEDSPRILGSPLTSRWSYSEAKAIDESLAHAFWRQKGLKVVMARLFNIVGPRQTGRYGMVVPRFVDQALAGEPLTVYGDGSQTRCFCHVDEAVAALINLVEHKEANGRVFNVGRPEEITIRGLAERVIELTGSSSQIRFVPYSEAYSDGFEDMERRVPDITRANESIGFAPKVGLDEILGAVIADRMRERRGNVRVQR
jgi:UDP-glucose 4-epimerase